MKRHDDIDEIFERNLSKTNKELFKLYKETLIELKQDVEEAQAVYDSLTKNKKALVKRKQRILDDLEKRLGKLYDQANVVIEGHKQDNLIDGYQTVFYKLEQDNPIEIPFNMLPEKTVTAAINQPVAGKILSKRLYANRDRLAKIVQSEMTRGIIKGDSYAKLAGRLNIISEASYKQAVRIARTEGGRMRSIGNQKAYEENKKLGIELEKMWISSLDDRTRRSHQELDGQKVAIDEKFKTSKGREALAPRLFGIAGEDINCRCTTIEVLKDYPPEFRRDGDGEVIEYQTYDQWKNAKVDGKTNELKKVADNGIIELPETLVNYKKHSLEWEEKIVKSILDDNEIELIGKEIKTLIDENEYSMRVGSDIIGEILKDGHFKNQFETNTSGGVYDYEMRKKATRQLFGGKTRSLKPENYEKYGYLGHKDFIEDVHETTAGQYGSVIIHFDKKHFNQNVTYTVNDSLGMALNKLTVAGDPLNPKANGIDYRRLKEVLNLFTSDNKPIGLTEFADGYGMRYIELQYHGEVKFDYVKEICFTEGLPDEKVMEQLKAKNIKLYEMKGEWGDEVVTEIR